MDIYKAFEEAILRAKEHPNLSSESQARLFALHQQATTGNYAGSETGTTDPAQLKTWENYRGLSKDDARQQYINFVAELTKSRTE